MGATMKRNVLPGAVIALWSIGSATGWCQGQGQAREIVAAHCSAVERAFEARDAKALAALYAPDADSAVLSGPATGSLRLVRARGRNEVEGVYQSLFEMFPKARLKLALDGARSLMPDVIVAGLTYEVTGMPAGAGPVRAVTFLVLQKRDGQWLVASGRHLAVEPGP